MALVSLHDGGRQRPPEVRPFGDPGPEEVGVEGHGLGVATGEQVGFIDLVPADDVGQGEVDADAAGAAGADDVEGGRAADGEAMAARLHPAFAGFLEARQIDLLHGQAA